MFSCEVCGAPGAELEDDDGMIVCDDCEQNRNEQAWERQCERFYGGDGPLSLEQQMANARKLK